MALFNLKQPVISLLQFASAHVQWSCSKRKSKLSTALNICINIGFSFATNITKDISIRKVLAEIEARSQIFVSYFHD